MICATCCNCAPMLVVGNCGLERGRFRQRGRQRGGIADAVGERIVGGLHQRHAAVGGQQAVERIQARLRCRGCVESRELQRLPRRQRHRLRLDTGSFQRVAGHREERREVGGIDVLRRDVVGRAAGPSGGAVSLRDGGLPVRSADRSAKTGSAESRACADSDTAPASAAAPAGRRWRPPPVPCSRTGWRLRPACRETRRARRRCW